MGKLTTLVGKFANRGKEKGGTVDQPERRNNTPPRVEPQTSAETQRKDAGGYHGTNGARSATPELSGESEWGEGHYDNAFGSDVSTEFRPNTYSGELDGLVVTRPTFQSMVFHRPKSAVGGSKSCASCGREADPRHPGSLFTAECGHTFHFECIALGLDLGQLRCPLCRKTWRRLPDTGGWANGALGYSYQGQPVNRKSGAPRPPRSNPRSSPPPTAFDEHGDIDLNNIPVAAMVPPPGSGQLPGGPPTTFALDKPPTFRDLADAPSSRPSYQGTWAKQQLGVDLDEYDAEQSPADPFHFHRSEQFSDVSADLEDLPSPVALKRGGDFASRKVGLPPVPASEPEFEFGTTAQSTTEATNKSSPTASEASRSVDSPNQLPKLPSVKTAPSKAPAVSESRVDPPRNAGPPAPVFARRRRTSKDSSLLPSIGETSSPDKRFSLRPPPGRRTPPASPRRRYERRQAALLEEGGGSPKLTDGAESSPLAETRPADGRTGGGPTPPSGRGNLAPPPGRGPRLSAGKQDDRDWATFFSPSAPFEPTPESVQEVAKGVAEEVSARRFVSPAQEPNLSSRGKVTRPLGIDSDEQSSRDSPAKQASGDSTRSANPPDFASNAKAFKVLGRLPLDGGVNGLATSTGVEVRSPELLRGSPSPPASVRSPSRGYPDHLESIRTSFPVEGSWSSMDETEREVKVDTNSNIVYSRSVDRPKETPGRSDRRAERQSRSSSYSNGGSGRPDPAPDSRGWFYNSDFGTDSISELLRGVQVNRVANEPEAWKQESGHQFGGSLQAAGGFDMAKFEAAIGPEMFDDDDPVTALPPLPGSAPELEISVRSEHPAVAAAESRDRFLCLVTVKAAPLLKPSAGTRGTTSQPSPANAHHARGGSGSNRSFDSDHSGLVGTSSHSRKRTSSRGSVEVELAGGVDRSQQRLARAGSADMALLRPLEKRDSADLDGWLTEQMTERLRLQESVCPPVDAPGGISEPSEPATAALEEARAPLDLVAIIDVSKSMMGRKLRLVQKTIDFVTQNLGPNDRLSVVAFSKKAYRVTPLLRVTEQGRERIVSAVKRIEVSSGTNIGAGLRMGLKVLKDARTRNPVRAVVLLSDGQDSWGRREMSLLLPEWATNDSHGIAVHTFGFGGDHDAEAMHSVASEARGTYSFIKKTEGVQDAFARCIGGLLTVVAQDVTVALEVSDRGGAGNACRIQHLHAGMFERTVDEAGTRAEVVLGDMYAEETRDILVELRLPAVAGQDNDVGMSTDGRQLVLAVSGNFVQARTQLIKAAVPATLYVSRPLVVPSGSPQVDISVDRQRNRLLATRAMSTAREWAELGQLGAAQKMLENAIKQIGQSFAFAKDDPLTLQLDHDLRECAVGFASSNEYEERGRAFSMSQGLSHTMQRASTSSFRRGLRTGSGGYSTSTMEFMINRSQCFDVR